MSQQNVTVYSDEALMANGSNGESTLQVVTPQAIDEPEVGLVPQITPSRLLHFLVIEEFL